MGPIKDMVKTMDKRDSVVQISLLHAEAQSLSFYLFDVKNVSSTFLDPYQHLI